MTNTDETSTTVAVTRTGPEWANIIRNDLGRAVEGIISAGQHLNEAKAEVGHGEWLPMLHGIGISQRHAQKLMQIGEQFSNASYMTHLPSTMVALYELSRLDPEEVEASVEDGTINPDMTVQDARALAGKPETSAFDKALKNLRAFEKNAAEVHGDELDMLIAAHAEARRQLDWATGGRA